MPLITSTPFKSPSFEQVILGDSPFFWYRLGESSGTTAFAEVGTDGSYVNTPTLGEPGLIQDDPSTAVKFKTGQNEVMVLPLAMSIVKSANFSIETYVRAQTGNFRALYAESATPSPPLGKATSLNIQGGGQFAVQIWTGSNQTVVSTTTVTAGQTYHVVFTKHSTNGMKLYVNGTLEDTDPNTTSTTLTIGDVWLSGGRNGATGGFYQGLEDDVVGELIGYKYELSQSQVTEHAAFLAS